MVASVNALSGQLRGEHTCSLRLKLPGPGRGRSPRVPECLLLPGWGLPHGAVIPERLLDMKVMACSPLLTKRHLLSTYYVQE